MPRAKDDTWKEEVLARLRHLDPTPKTLPCNDESRDDKKVAYVPVARVCYFTTKTGRKGYNLMAVLDDGRHFFFKDEIGAIEELLAPGYPQFYRSGKLFLVNLDKVRLSRITGARDLVFEGSKDWVKNAVAHNTPRDEHGNPTGPQYLDGFQARYHSHV